MPPKFYQCLSCRLASSLRLHNAPPPPPTRRAFSTTTSNPARRRRNISLARLGPGGSTPKPSPKDDAQRIDQLASHLKPYTARENELLAQRYTPEQMRVIEAGESAIDPKDMVKQGRLRGDAGRIPYLDDFATLRPTLDKLPAQSDQNEDGSFKPRVKRLPFPGPSTPSATAGTEAGAVPNDPHLQRLSLTTHLSIREIKQLRIKNLVSHRVVNQTRMGKIQSFYFLTIAGNQNGLLGIGEGKAAEDEDGRRQAMMNAVRNLKPVARYEERTIYGDVEAKVGATIVQLSNRPPGAFSCLSLLSSLVLTLHTQASGIVANTSSSSSRARQASRTWRLARLVAGIR